MLASQKFGYSAEQVLQACQALYETHKLTSYPRTDCGYLPEVSTPMRSAVLAAVRHVNPELAALIDRADPTLKSPAWNDAKVTAHHGIIPTMHRGEKGALSERERNVYELIVRRYIAQFYPDHEYLQTRVTVDVAGHDFVTSGKVVTCEGWREVDRWQDDDEKSGDDAAKRNRRCRRCARTTRSPARKAERKDCRTKPPAEVHRRLARASHGADPQVGQGPRAQEAPARGRRDRHRSDPGSDSFRPQAPRVPRGAGQAIVSTALGRALIDVLPEAVKSPALTALYERMLKQSSSARCELTLSSSAKRLRQRASGAGRSRRGHAARVSGRTRKRAAPRRRSVRRPKAHRRKERTA